MSKPIFTISTEDLLVIRKKYIEDLKWWFSHPKEDASVDSYMFFLQGEVSRIDEEIDRRGYSGK